MACFRGYSCRGARSFGRRLYQNNSCVEHPSCCAQEAFSSRARITIRSFVILKLVGVIGFGLVFGIAAALSGYESFHLVTLYPHQVLTIVISLVRKHSKPFEMESVPYFLNHVTQLVLISWIERHIEIQDDMRLAVYCALHVICHHDTVPAVPHQPSIRVNLTDFIFTAFIQSIAEGTVHTYPCALPDPATLLRSFPPLVLCLRFGHSCPCR